MSDSIVDGKLMYTYLTRTSLYYLIIITLLAPRRDWMSVEGLTLARLVTALNSDISSLLEYRHYMILTISDNPLK